MALIVDLSALGDRGLIIGGKPGDLAGTDVSSIGDYNGDGFDDVIVVADRGGDRDQAYVVFGKAGRVGSIDLASIGPSDGFAILADVPYLNVSAAGDINGDGFDDFVVGKSGGSYAGGLALMGTPSAYVIFGKSAGIGSIDLEHLAPTDGFMVTGRYAGPSTLMVSDAGDLNGDGFGDVILGSSKDENNTGAAYVIFGKAGTFDTIDLGNFGITAGFAIKGEASGDYAGSSVSRAGDFNGDGFGDLLIGAIGNDQGEINAGAAYVVFGKANGFETVNLANLDPSAGFKILGGVAGDFAFDSVSAAGDVNGDGFDDIVIGSWRNDSNTGAAYVIFGKAHGFGTIDLATLAPTAGFQILGDAAGQAAARSVSGAGDVNADGYDDILIGAPRLGGPGIGEKAYLIFGHAGSFGTINVSYLAPATGIIFQGPAADENTGESVSAAGDVNGDGYADLLIGAPFGDLNGYLSGKAYVVFGRESFGLPHDDVNGDGRSDIIFRDNSSGLLFDWLGSGNGSFGSNTANFATTISTEWRIAGTGDFNGDGRADILWRQDVTGHLLDWLGNASGGFNTNPQNFDSAVPANIQIVGTADVNGDGRDDILFRDNNNGLLFNWLGQENGGFVSNASNFATVISNEWRVIGTGDFNGDGRDDILWRQDGTGHLLDWLGNMSGGFNTNASSFDSAIPLNVAFSGTGDFNGDGRDDILWRGNDGLLFNWLGQANGGFVSNTANFATAISNEWRVVSVGDFNADGRDDILWRQDGSGHLLDWLGNAVGGFNTNPQNFDSSIPAGLTVQDPFL